MTRLLYPLFFNIARSDLEQRGIARNPPSRRSSRKSERKARLPRRARAHGQMRRRPDFGRQLGGASALERTTAPMQRARDHEVSSSSCTPRQPAWRMAPGPALHPAADAASAWPRRYQRAHATTPRERHRPVVTTSIALGYGVQAARARDRDPPASLQRSAAADGIQPRHARSPRARRRIHDPDDWLPPAQACAARRPGASARARSPGPIAGSARQAARLRGTA